MMTENFWDQSAFSDDEKSETPKQILNKQAAAVESLSKGKLYATVETRSSNNKFVHNLLIHAPSLDGYTTALISACHGVLLFPCEVISLQPIKDIVKECDDITEFKDALRDALNRNHIREIIRSLISQSS